MSWVDSANGHPDFPIQNLPLGRYARDGGAVRAGVAIGDCVVDLQALLETGLLGGEAGAAAARAASSSPNALLALAPSERRTLRAELSRLLSAGATGNAARRHRAAFLHEASACRMTLPAEIGNFSDFNAGIHHSANGGRRRGQADPLLPNYRHVPVAYHGRASSIRPSGTAVQRPWGQSRPSDDQPPVFAPSARLDFELELGIWVGPGCELGCPIEIDRAHAHIAGYALLNDWSARDLQVWESPRLGPFLGKSFATTVSPWVISPEALAPFRAPAFPRAAGDPAPLRYLVDAEDQRSGALALSLEVQLSTAARRRSGQAPVTIARSDARHLYWTPAQMLAHQTSNGCDVRAGDLLGSGTITGPDPHSFGTMLDAIWPDSPYVPVGDERRVFLEDGDEVVLLARAEREGYATIGFGECRAIVLPARERLASW